MVQVRGVDGNPQCQLGGPHRAHYVPHEGHHDGEKPLANQDQVAGVLGGHDVLRGGLDDMRQLADVMSNCIIGRFV